MANLRNLLQLPLPQSSLPNQKQHKTTVIFLRVFKSTIISLVFSKALQSKSSSPKANGLNFNVTSTQRVGRKLKYTRTHTHTAREKQTYIHTYIHTYTQTNGQTGGQITDHKEPEQERREKKWKGKRAGCRRLAGPSPFAGVASE